MARKNKSIKKTGGGLKFWGRHAIEAALDNPRRVIKKISITREALATLEIPDDIAVVICDVADLGRVIPRDAPHQGMVADVDPLPDIWLGDILDEQSDRPLLLLDQVTDPHNVGAILRSAAAFDAAAIITQDRHAPPESGVVAKSASGALETVPWVRVVNLSRALDDIAEAGYWRIGLDGDATDELEGAMGSGKIALVMGAEGEGLRQNVAAHCDTLARLPMSSKMESLNVSNAAAISLYAEYTRNKGE
ncbi:23S rRNA (guanosine(2251)-2'-O)-methyltransferase RlmB [Parasphingorhabdus flavimaris]|jgi:23S rRNA (guanosine2251-2'-O)-methyltransferase|uniref:23S rRNA (Guanosine(2251)-2'-O)-methyltransferase RlmB n=1 Tax=Parasphingorhabdus flavimaris TaxID=266812 RepID=A0ABX2N3Y8_9SPHN|nr:23S rRNA (guanosine(2251)-2'-O)-methyltransferase RlmB [Parasphingorhabdus flavimaris]NVD28431.1 23S rRNA (guanosine(2251)-2'-O)-methyltransferase RlmB [Parasphingorhabdus flavimaris]|tara:strand:- start:8587 stop:9333 length:747 start_codon:yes stop_codon:yes gene_type:complete